MTTATVRIERRDSAGARLVTSPKPGKLYEEHPDLTVAWDHYYLDIRTESAVGERFYTMLDEILLVTVHATWPSGIGGYNLREGMLSQEPLDLELKPVNQDVANFLMLAQIRARAEELNKLTGKYPHVYISREDNPWHCYRLPCDSSSMRRIAQLERRLCYRGDPRTTEYYTCAKGIEPFFTPSASSSNPRP